MTSFDVFLELSSDDVELSLASVAAMIRLDINSLLLLLLLSMLFELLFCVSFCLCAVLLLGILIWPAAHALAALYSI